MALDARSSQWTPGICPTTTTVCELRRILPARAPPSASVDDGALARRRGQRCGIVEMTRGVLNLSIVKTEPSSSGEDGDGRGDVSPDVGECGRRGGQVEPLDLCVRAAARLRGDAFTPPPSPSCQPFKKNMMQRYKNDSKWSRRGARAPSGGDACPRPGGVCPRPGGVRFVGGVIGREFAFPSENARVADGFVLDEEPVLFPRSLSCVEMSGLADCRFGIGRVECDYLTVTLRLCNDRAIYGMSALAFRVN